MKISFVATVLNEEVTIKAFLISLLNQSEKPDEIIIVDGGSSDRTVAEIKNHPFGKLRAKIKSPIILKIIEKRGNRAVGRNEGIKKATGDIILISDAGCTLDKNWVKKITEPFFDPKVDVIAGYYDAKPKTIFQKCLVPYVLVMPDRVGSASFLPASRSMAFRKSIWKKLGGFPEEFSHNEDYVFANRLKTNKAKIVFQKEAIVDWIPRKNIKEAFIMFFRFALGDAEAGIFRQTVFFVFIRYILGIYLLMLSLIEKSILLLFGIFFCMLLYIM